MILHFERGMPMKKIFHIQKEGCFYCFNIKHGRRSWQQKMGAGRVSRKSWAWVIVTPSSRNLTEKENSLQYKK